MENNRHNDLQKPLNKNLIISSPDYSHGYENGQLDLDKSHYEGYLSNNALYTKYNERITARRKEISSLEETLNETRQQSTELLQKIHTHAYNIPVKAGQVDRLRHEVTYAQTEKERLREERKNSRSDNAFIIGLLYIIAGGFFITGDLIISKDIVAYAFGFHGFEAWSFAGGLAALSLLLKPAYERLVEDYYRHGNIKRYVYFKIALLFFALSTLAILGLYRYEAYRVDKMKLFLNNEAAYLQNGTNGASDALVRQLDRLRQQRIELNQELLNDPWGVWAFVLTGILFAVSGAVSLGIGMPIVQTYWRRWVQLPLQIHKLKRREKRLAIQLEKAQAELAQEQARKEISESQLAALPDQSELRNEVRTIQAEIRELADQVAIYEAERRISQYNDGYVKGIVQKADSQQLITTQENYSNHLSTGSNPPYYPSNGNGHNGKN